MGISCNIYSNLTFTINVVVLIGLHLLLVQILMSSKDGVGGGRGVGGGHQPTGGTGRGEGPRRWASEEPVLQQQPETRTSPNSDSGKVWRSSEQQQAHRSDLSPAQSQQDTADMATTRYTL